MNDIYKRAMKKIENDSNNCRFNSAFIVTGPTGPMGPTGATGPTGPQG